MTPFPFKILTGLTVIYGAGGAIGSAVARAFAREGAKLFLTGHHRVSMEAVAKEVVSAGGSAEAAEVDALDEQAVDEHLRSVIAARTHARRLTTLAELADAAVLISDKASGMMGTTVNLTMGSLDD